MGLESFATSSGTSSVEHGFELSNEIAGSSRLSPACQVSLIVELPLQAAASKAAATSSKERLRIRTLGRTFLNAQAADLRSTT